MAKTNAEIQQEYNEALKVSQSLTGALNKMINDTEASQKKVSDAQKAYNNNLKSIYSSAQDVESTQKAIEAAEKSKAGLAKRYFGANAKLLPTKRAEAQAGIDILKSEKKRLEVVQQVDESQQKLTNSINGVFDGLVSGLDEIPVIGKMFSSIAEGPVNYLKNSVSNAGKQFVTTFSNATKDGATGMQAFSKAGGASMRSLAASLAGPQAIIAVIVAIAAAGVIAFYKVSKAAKEFRNETGLLTSQTGDLESKFAAVARNTSAMGGSIEDASKAASTFSNQFTGTQQASKAILTSMVAMEKSFGVSAESQAKVNEQFQLMAGSSAETAQNMIQTTIAAAEAAGVAPAAVMQDIAENAEAGMMFFRGSTKALAKAAIEARKMGTSIGETTKVAEGLLDFESSITKELELGAMLGARVNFNKARALAFEGKTVEAQKAVNAEVSKLGDINKMNMYQKRALADATNMDLKSLIKQQEIAKKFKNIDDEKLAAANALLDAGMKIGEIGDKDLERKAIEMGNQKKMQSEFDNMGNSLKAMGNNLLMAFMPIGKLIMGVLGPVIGYITGVWAPIGRAIEGVMDAFKPIQSIMKDIFGDGAGLASIFQFIGNIVSSGIVFSINLFSNGLKMVMSIVGGIYDIFKGIFTGDFDLILDGLMSLGEGILRFFASIPMVLWDTITDIFPSIGNYISDFFSSIGSKIKNLFMSIVPDWIRDWFSGDSDLASDASQLQSAGSINDGIVQDGKIISTNPEDTLIATKTPDDFLSNLLENSPLGMMAGGLTDAAAGIGSMLGIGQESNDEKLIAKLDELIVVMSGNKDVYMDGKKVTAGVSNTVDKIGANSYAIV